MNGLVYRINEGIYLSLVIKVETISDGIPISEGVYSTLKDNEISYIDVNITDGTKPLKIDDINDFIYNQATRNSGDIFYSITDIAKYSYKASIEEIIDDVGLDEIFKDIIEDVKNI